METSREEKKWILSPPRVPAQTKRAAARAAPFRDHLSHYFGFALVVLGFP